MELSCISSVIDGTFIREAVFFFINIFNLNIHILIYIHKLINLMVIFYFLSSSEAKKTRFTSINSGMMPINKNLVQ